MSLVQWETSQSYKSKQPYKSKFMSVNNAGNRVSQTGAPLDIYNENTSWTPTVFGDTTAGIGTYTTQQGYSTQIGEFLYITAKIVWTGHTGSGQLRMDLPIPVRSSLPDYAPTGTFASENLNLPAGNRFVISFFLPGTTTVNPKVIRDNNTYSSINLANNGEILYEGWYLI